MDIITYANICIKDKLTNTNFSKKVIIYNDYQLQIIFTAFLTDLISEYNLLPLHLEIYTDYISEDEYFMR